MNRIFYFFSAIVIISLLSLPSCKKEEEEPDLKPTIIGDPSFQLPAYVKTKSVWDLVATGIKESEKVEYLWLCPDFTKDTIKGPKATITFPDSLGVFSVKLVAKKEGYYDKTFIQYVTTIDSNPGASLTGITRGMDSIVDIRDNHQYYTAKIGKLEWFTQNLNWAEKGAAYGKADAIGDIMGRLYSWDEATSSTSAIGLGNGPQGVCPESWSIPTDEDWMDFAKSLNGGVELPFYDEWNKLGEMLCVRARFNDRPVWPYSPNNNNQNKFGWNALPAGSSTNNFNNYSSLFEYAFWWTSTEKSADSANYRYIYYDQPSFPLNFTDKTQFGASVRCVRLAK